MKSVWRLEVVEILGHEKNRQILAPGEFGLASMITHSFHKDKLNKPAREEKILKTQEISGTRETS